MGWLFCFLFFLHKAHEREGGSQIDPVLQTDAVAHAFCPAQKRYLPYSDVLTPLCRLSVYLCDNDLSEIDDLGLTRSDYP